RDGVVRARAAGEDLTSQPEQVSRADGASILIGRILREPDFERDPVEVWAFCVGGVLRCSARAGPLPMRAPCSAPSPRWMVSSGVGAGCGRPRRCRVVALRAELGRASARWVRTSATTPSGRLSGGARAAVVSAGDDVCGDAEAEEGD